ncbi:MAG: SusD/RagB family nutrient-binding outer membrane lipoprotein [Dysgonamonadaceae bacterium]|jgi:hypothetical protein|nr:SusD/RagB family nutrient-binding outer membrane lipoprotein [Dysgonamonadaceae bacterium]
MKKIILFLAIAVSFANCSEWLDVNHDPNNPEDVGAFLSLPAAEGFAAAQIGGIMYNYSGIFAQYIDQLPECMQYNDITTYRLTPASQLFDRCYSGFYAGSLEDLHAIISSESSTESEKFVATVLRVAIFQVIVDQMDQAPYAEALQGANVPMPKFDSGESIYAGLLAELDAVLATSPTYPISGDLIFSNDLSQWKAYAKALKLKLLMRASYAQDNSAKIKALIDEGDFFTGDVKFAAFSDENNKRNPWYQTNVVSLNTQNLSASHPLVSFLKVTGDPRISTIFKTTGSGEYSGIVPGGRVGDTSLKKANFSEPNVSPTQPVYFFLQSELQFFLAEAYLRFYNDDAKAKAAYEAGIAANFATRGISGTDAIINGDATKWQGSTAEKLVLIGLQKWVGSAMLNNVEAWAEVRRTGVPTASSYTGEQVNANPTVYTPGQLISPMSNALGNGSFPKRVFFPESAMKYNLNTPAQKKLTDKVWWDKK